MKRKSILLVVLLFPLFVLAQDKKESPVNVKLGGFIKADYMYDTRQTEEAVDGLYQAYPKNISMDFYGNDINAKSKTNGCAVTTRLTTTITAPDVLKAKTGGYIEFDFSARTANEFGSSATVRFRQAWIKLDWEKISVLFGQDWHPLCVKEMFPSVLNLNTGAPFQPFNRSPQLTLKYYLSPNFMFLGSALMQNDYVNFGPSGLDDGKQIRNHMFQRYAITPNVHLQLRVTSENMMAGFAFDYKQLQPQITTRPSAQDSGYVMVTNEKISSHAFMGFLRYKYNKFELKGKAIWGQNLSEHLMPGGYAVSNINHETGYETYTPSNNTYLWGNVLYGNVFQVGLFAGYYKNHGFSDNIVANPKLIYGRAANIASIYRLAPIVNYKPNKNLVLSLEWEYTSAAYGEIDFLDKGNVINTNDVANNRIQFTAFLFF